MLPRRVEPKASDTGSSITLCHLCHMSQKKKLDNVLNKCDGGVGSWDPFLGGSQGKVQLLRYF